MLRPDNKLLYSESIFELNTLKKIKNKYNLLFFHYKITLNDQTISN